MFFLVILFCMYNIAVQSIPDECPEEPLERYYDYIIAGGGTAGCVLAARLSEDPSVSVLLLEAGSRDYDVPFQALIETPRIFRGLRREPTAWRYETVPQKTAFFDFENNRIIYWCGRLLGGASSNNAMVWSRGAKVDYDQWEKDGATGWSWNDVLPFFRRSEEIRVPELLNSPYRGNCGPMVITRSENSNTSVTELMFKATEQIGQRRIKDCNGPYILGVCFRQRSVGSGQRQSTSRKYLRPALGRPNLRVLTEALVEKVLFSRYGRKVVGVRFFHEGRLKTVHAKEEVIVSAGSFRSPQILMLSGIGPKEHLKPFKIPTKVNLPVGSNLQGQPVLPLQIFFNLNTIKLSNLTDPEEVAKYLFRRKGLYADNVFSYVGMTIKSHPSEKYPDLSFGFSDGLSENGAGGISEDSFKEKTVSTNRNNVRDGVAIRLTLLHPRSRGTIRLRSRSAKDLPLIDPRDLSEDVDVRKFIIDHASHHWPLQSSKVNRSLGPSVRTAQRLAKTPAMRRVQGRFDYTRDSRCKQYRFNSDPYWACFLRYNGRFSHHLVSVNRMGGPRDRNSVVDPQLRVKGVKGLRVADASIMPQVPSASTYAPTVMIGEKAADLIKQTLRQKRLRRAKHYQS